MAANLAAALAAGGTPTLLVEANLRTPDLAEAIRPPDPSRGLSDYLLDDALLLSDVTHSQIAPDLGIVYAGADPVSAAERLGSARFGQFVESCLRSSDCTVFDTAPANRSTDARVVAKAVGYALLVCREGRTFFEDIALLSDQLRQDNVVIVGTILNHG